MSSLLGGGGHYIGGELPVNIDSPFYADLTPNDPLFFKSFSLHHLITPFFTSVSNFNWGLQIALRRFSEKYFVTIFDSTNIKFAGLEICTLGLKWRAPFWGSNQKEIPFFGAHTEWPPFSLFKEILFLHP